MKCLKMKLTDVLFFTTNFLITYSLDLRQNKLPETSSLANEDIWANKFDQNCPQLSKIIRDHKLTNYTLKCKVPDTESATISEETVLEYACLAVQDILSFMCSKKLNLTSDFFKQEEVKPFCPFNFSYLEELDIMLDNDKIKELTNTDHCEKVCHDLYFYKPQCYVLNRLINFLNFTPETPLEEIDKPPAEPVNPDTIMPKTDSDIVIAKKENEVSLKSEIKEVTIEEKFKATDRKPGALPAASLSKNDSRLPKEEKNMNKPLIPSTPKIEHKTSEGIQPSNIEMKDLDNENILLESGDLKPSSENCVEQLNNKDEMSSLKDSYPPTRIESENELKSSLSLKGKEIFAGDGFFQAEDSHFFFYFIMVSSVIVVGYLAFHNKNKILAYAIEGTSGRRNRRRPNPARYRKLETNLEEVISSNAPNAAASSVVY